MRHAVLWVVGGGLMLAAGVAAWQWPRSPYANADAALAAFYSAEPQAGCAQAMPLRRHGPAVVPLVLRDLVHKDMPRRRHAVSFLALEKVQQALPLLAQIVRNGSEHEYIRADALRAIFAIAPEQAQKLAAEVLPASTTADSAGLLTSIQATIRRGDTNSDLLRLC